MTNDPEAPVPILFVWDAGFSVLASSFEEFVRRYMAGDEAILYGAGVVP